MKALKLALIGGVAAAAVAGFASVASAADAPSLAVAYNVGLATDYVFRGIDQSPFVAGGTDNSAEIFGGVDATYGGFYAGTWLSNTGPGQSFLGVTGEGLEYDIYGGYKLPVGPATLDLGVITYNYSHGSFVTDKLNNYELKAAISAPVGGATLGAVVYWTPDFGGSGEGAEYVEANAAYTFGNKATVSGAVGYQAVDDSFYTTSGYTTWNVGVTYPITDKVSLDARYIGTTDDADDVGFASRGKAVATVKVAF